MKILVSMALAAALLACGGKTPAPTTTPAAKAETALQIRHTSVYVDDQDKALHFYTDVLGFAKKDDVRNGPYRWLTVTSAGDADGGELQLALDDNPAAKAYQAAMLEQTQPALMLYTGDVKREYERIKALGGVFTMPPTEVMAGSIIATLNDTCGNLVQLTQLTQLAR